MKHITFSLKEINPENIQKYVNFINDNELCNKLDSFETGYQNGNFYIDIEGPKDVVEQIVNLNILKPKRTKKNINK